MISLHPIVSLFTPFVFVLFGNAIPSLLLAIIPFFIVSTPHFSTPRFIPMSLLNICTVWINDSSDFPLLAYKFRSSIKSRWLTFCLLLAKWYPGAASLTICVSGSRHTTNNNGDKELPWKIPRLNLSTIFLSTRQFYRPWFHIFCHLLFISAISKQSIIQKWGTIS